MKMTEAFEEFYLERRTIRWKTSSKQSNMQRVATLKKHIGDKRVADVTEDDLHKLQKKLAGAYVVNYVNSLMSIVGNVLDTARKNKLIKENPFDFIEPLKARRDEHQLGELDVYTIEESERILDACLNESHRNILEFLFWTGIRPGEMAALQWADVNGNTVSITKTNTLIRDLINTPKTGRNRVVTLPERAVSVLDRLPNRLGAVFLNSRGRPFPRSRTISNTIWRQITERAGVRYLPMYHTRHSFASWMLKAGEPEEKIAQHLGHASLAMLRNTYGHFIPEQGQKWTLDDPKKVVELTSRMKSGTYQ